MVSLAGLTALVDIIEAELGRELTDDEYFDIEDAVNAATAKLV